MFSMNKIRFFCKYRPLSVLAMAGALRDILLGIGFLIGLEQITQTLIYQNYDELIPGISGPVVGVLLVAISLCTIGFAAMTKRVALTGALKVQAALWLFSTLMYILNGHWLLAGIFGIFFCFPAAFIAFYVKYNPPQDHVLAELVKKDA